ncbi:unnamed protein product [Ectocarpus sp. 6 AP-2014]
MEHLLLLLGMIGVFGLIFAVTRTLCRDPDLLQPEGYMERQQALAEAVVRQMDTHELVAIASGRFGSGGGLLSRGRGRASRRFQRAEQTAGVSQETRMSFVKLSAGKRGLAPARDVTAPPPPSSAVARLAPSSSSPDDEGKSQQAADSSGCAWAGGGSKSPTLYYERSNPLCRKPCVEVGSSSPSVSSARPRSSKRFFIDGGGGGGNGGAAAAGGVYSDNSCSVCLDDYEEGDELLQVTCGHVFHRACIDHWLKAHRVCPCCRTDLDKLAQVVQLFPQISKRSLQNALTRAEGNIVLAVEFLLTRPGGDGSTPDAGSGGGDSRGDGGREAVEVSSSAATAAATEHDNDDDDDACRGGGEEAGRGRTAARKPRWGGGYVVSPYSAMAARGGNPALLRSGGFLQGGGFGRGGGGGAGMAARPRPREPRSIPRLTQKRAATMSRRRKRWKKLSGSCWRRV